MLSASLTIPKLFSISQLEDGGLSATDIRRPNILLIGSDGLNASNTSVYGYERDTTPNLRHLADESLLAENAFTNSAKTSGSIISIFNSKLPTQTRVIYPPDILRNSNSYQHLPGILHKLGYRTIEISISHYIDAYTLNLRDGFDIVNDRSEDQAGFQIFSRFPAFQDFGYFFSVLVERVSTGCCTFSSSRRCPTLIKKSPPASCHPWTGLACGDFSLTSKKRTSRYSYICT